MRQTPVRPGITEPVDLRLSDGMNVHFGRLGCFFALRRSFHPDPPATPRVNICLNKRDKTYN